MEIAQGSARQSTDEAQAAPPKQVTSKLMPADAPEWELFRTYIDLYKHHFELFVKGYVVYLAIIGAIAGFVFRPETGELMRRLLLVLALICSTLAMAAWLTALFWANAFGKQVNDICQQLGTPKIPMFGTRIILFLSALASFVMILGSAILIYRQV